MSQLASPNLLIVCETEPEEVDDHEHQYRRPRDGQVQLTILQSHVQLRSQVRIKSADRPHDCGVNDSVKEIDCHMSVYPSHQA